MAGIVKDQKIRVLIAVGQVIFRQGLRILLEKKSDIVIAGEASTGDEVPRLIIQKKPHILLLDAALSGDPPFECLRRLRESKEGTAVRTILLMPSLQQAEIVRAVKLGASGVVLKDAAPEMLLKAIHAVMNGVLWIDREIVQRMIHALHDRGNAAQDVLDLTPRELDIVRAVVQGQVNKEIAETFRISEYTVKHHLTRIFDKLRVANRVELAVFAVTHRLFNGSDNNPAVGQPA